MGNAVRRRGERPRSGLRDVYVARTVQEPQKGFERFLNRFARHLGAGAMINTIGSTHLTFLESSGVMGHFRSRGYTPSDVRAFKCDLEHHLKDTLPSQHAIVEVNNEVPFKWMAGRATLALNVVEDEHLTQERDKIEGFLRDHFGVLPHLRTFDPHITLGRLTRRPTATERSDPLELLPDDLRVPAGVALNGLETYLGRIHAGSRIHQASS
jgi:hypothetical protein